MARNVEVKARVGDIMAAEKVNIVWGTESGMAWAVELGRLLLQNVAGQGREASHGQ